MKDLSDQLAQVRRLCHRLCSTSCVEEKRQGCHELLLDIRPHWSVLKKEEQHCRIDQGETIPFDISLPLPARDERPDSDQGARLFWERFRCQQCGLCCYTPGAGLLLEEEDFKRIAKTVGKKSSRRYADMTRPRTSGCLNNPAPFMTRGNEAARSTRSGPSPAPSTHFTLQCRRCPTTWQSMPSARQRVFLPRRPWGGGSSARTTGRDCSEKCSSSRAFSSRS